MIELFIYSFYHLLLLFIKIQMTFSYQENVIGNY